MIEANVPILKYCPQCDTKLTEELCMKCKSVGKQESVFEKEIWNAAIEAAALIVQPKPHVDEERRCEDIAEAIRRLKKMTVRKLTIWTKFNIDKVELEMIEDEIILTVNDQQSVLDRNAGDLIRLWLQEHLK